jgi:hypothetical protein
MLMLSSVQKRLHTDRPAFRVLDVPVGQPGGAGGGVGRGGLGRADALGAAAPGPPVETEVGQA